MTLTQFDDLARMRPGVRMFRTRWTGRGRCRRTGLSTAACRCRGKKAHRV